MRPTTIRWTEANQWYVSPEGFWYTDEDGAIFSASHPDNSQNPNARLRVSVKETVSLETIKEISK